MEKTNKSILEMSRMVKKVNKVDEKENATKVVANIDLQRLYDNKLSTNLNAMDKDFAKKLKDVAKDIMQKCIVESIEKNKKDILAFISDDDMALVKKFVPQALGLDADKVSKANLKKAIISGCTYKFVKSGKNEKSGAWSYSVSAFLKSLNASIIGKVEKVSA